MIRCVAFDFDGTLVDSNRIKHQTFFDVVADIEGADEILSAILANPPGDRYAVFKRFVDIAPDRGILGSKDRASKPLAGELADEYTRRCEQAVSKCPEIPGATQVITELRLLGFTIAINSATPTGPLSAIVARRQWSHMVTLVLGGPSSKTDNLKAVGASNGAQPKEIVMVGDQEADRVGAAEFGCHFVALRRQDSQFSVEPGLQIDDLRKLPDLLRRIGEGR